jgi:dissimilatory sulfite reductase (desulfoviridin) alpha/beta subunit
MAERKPLSKKIRFEVFKRDAFTCQYCGQMAPDVLLEVDHIKPVASGGKNDLLNLVTACISCNRGKGANELDDSTAVKKQQKQLKELNERREQLKMMLEWKEQLAVLIEEQVDAIDALITERYNRTMTPEGRRRIKDVIRRFGFGEAYESSEISVNKYDDARTALNKIGGICYNRKNNITWKRRD